MDIVAGELPEDKKWRVLILAPLGQSQGLSMQLALALAKANNGDVVAAVIIPEDNEYHRASARSTIEHLQTFSNGSRKLHPVVVTAEAMDSGLVSMVKKANIDLILDDATDLLKYNLNKIPCPISVLRDASTTEDENGQPKEIKRILVPTSGGPNTAHVLSLLLPLTRELEVTALYIAREEQGENEKALGLERLRQTITFADANDRIKTKLISAESITDGILQEASEYDLVIVGASRESSLDKILFGNIPDTVVRDSKRPVMVVQQPSSRLSDMAGEVGFFLNRIVPRLTTKERGETYVRIRRNARASISFYILITLSAVIAALGLIVNSPAVVIGAMLVAPLMSPIVGIGMAMVLGDTRFLRLSLGAVLRGVGLAILVGMMAGLLVRGEPLTLELQARTQPSLFDLGIALFSGLAGAYALSISSAAGALPGVAIAAALVPPLATVGVALVGGHFRESMGAMLLFTTNLIAISVATAFTFLVLGFRPSPSQKQRRAARTVSARVAIVSLVFISGVLALTSYVLGEELRQADRIETVVREQMREQANAEVMTLDIESFENRHLVLDVVARSTDLLLYQQARDLQENIGTQLKDEGILDTIAMTFSVIRITELDPLNPPTPTPSPTPTLEPTAGPSPTVTPQPTATPAPTETPTPLPTATAEPTQTPTPIPSPTATPEPPTAIITSPFGLNLRSDPSTTSGILAILDPESTVVLLEGLVTAEGQTWQEVDANGRVGWVSAEYLTPN